MFSGISNRFSGFSFTSIVAYMGAQQGAQMAYLYGPALIRNAVISVAQRQFGYHAGIAIGNAAAPAAIAAAMPTLVAHAQVAGAFLAVASLSRIASVYNYVMHVKASRSQDACRALAPTYEKALVTRSLVDDQDFEEVARAPAAAA